MLDHDRLTDELRGALDGASAGLTPAAGLLDDIRRGHATYRRRTRAAWLAAPVAALGIVAVAAVVFAGGPTTTQPAAPNTAGGPSISTPAVTQRVQLAGYSVGLPAAFPECIPVPYGKRGEPGSPVGLLPTGERPCAMAAMPASDEFGPINPPAGATRVDVSNDLTAYIAEAPTSGTQQLWVQVPAVGGHEWLILATTRLTQEELIAAAKGVTVTIPTNPTPCQSPCG